MKILRTRIKKEIICEFIEPAEKSDKVIILCNGAPKYPERTRLMEFLSSQNYWVFNPRYRGSWESDGSFLKISPATDIIEVIDEIHKEFRELWDNKLFKINNPKIFLLGSSFGGPAALLASQDKRVIKAIAISPVTDWTQDGPDEPMGKLGKFMQDAFRNGYRFKQKDWDKLSKGKFYSPIAEVKNIDPTKILLFHALDDGSVPYHTAKDFAAKNSCKLISFKTGGHQGLSWAAKPKFWNKIKKFLDK